MAKRLYWTEPQSLFEVILISAEYRRRLKDQHTKKICGFKTQGEVHEYVMQNHLWEVLNNLPDSYYVDKPIKKSKKR